PVNDNLVELLAFADTCRRASAAQVCAVIPYFGYARADKRHGRREPITASMVAALLQAVGMLIIKGLRLFLFQEPLRWLESSADSAMWGKLFAIGGACIAEPCKGIALRAMATSQELEKRRGTDEHDNPGQIAVPIPDPAQVRAERPDVPPETREQSRADQGRGRVSSVRNTLLEFFDDVFTSPAEFLIHDTGYRSWTYSYEQVHKAAGVFAGRLRSSGIGKGDKIILWGENRPEWIVALWGCLLEGVIAVPIDYRASADLVHRIRKIVEARVLLIGDDVDVGSPESGIAVWRMGEIEWPAGASAPDRPAINPDDTAEILFTSGATADPKGVVITHRNILANIIPIEREVAKYRRYARPFFPIRFLNLLPLSHMFGQAMATFMPPMLPGTVAFMRGFNPSEIVRQMHDRRISVLVCVPKILDVLRGYVLQQVPEAREATETAARSRQILMRLWRYRRVHRLLGWKCWAFVVGAAPLERDLEEFWSRLGFAVVQGYGLTETAPVVTLNNPFKPARGTVGAPIGGVEVKIAPDGEILVRGANVTPGYYHAEAQTAEAFEGGWFHTGDIGEMDESGRLVVRGRKKEMIVTPEGLHVFPEDVERVLNDLPGVRESAVVGVARDGQERPHAVLALEPGASQDDVVRQANAKLEEHQKIRSASVWTGDGLPRTEGTRKLRRRELPARAPLRLDPRGRPGASASGEGSGDLCGEPSEPHGYARDSGRPAPTLALPGGARDVQRILRAALPSRAAHDAAGSDDPPDLLSRGPLVQRVSAATARGWRQGHTSLHWGACQCGPVDPDLSRRNAD
ncbi:MAG: AMP-binding protein, partial [Actinobacteria bacterium]|nr:AMP-binding protein [Actinomycetota bacterium]